MIYETDDTDTETIAELKELELVSFEENRLDEQIMDDKAEMKVLSDRHDQKIRNKQQK